MNSDEVLRALRPVLLLVMALWTVELMNLAMQYRLNQWFGLEPRSIPGLIGVPTMPLLHGSVGHAAANTLPMIFLGAIGFLVAPKRFLPASLIIVLLSGIAVWMFARGNSIHIGASGLIFGWFGFLVAHGVIERSLRAIVGAAIVTVLYGGMIWGVLPKDGVSISWEAHLFGALSGMAAAYYVRHRPRF
jgi:membrane associated rhomboid family serine protease